MPQSAAVRWGGRVGRGWCVAGYGIAYEYDLLGRPVSIGFAGSSPAELRWTWDKASRPLTAISYGRTIGYAYAPPAQGLAQTMTWPSGAGSLLTCTDALGRVTRLKEAADCTTDTGRLVTYGYDDLSRRLSAALANSTSSTWAYASTGALGSLNHNLSGSSGDATFTYSYNRALQLQSVERSNDAYAWTNHYNVKRPYATNALDQYTKVSLAKPTYDARGNLASDNIGGRPWAYAYDAENRLVQASLRGATTLTLSYDPAGRLRRSEGDGTTEFLYDGDRLVGEYVSGTLVRRYVPGPAPDETVLAYEGADKFWYYRDHLGSVIATAGTSGAVAAINAYGPFGEPGVPATNRNVGRLRYTGQIHLPEVGFYHYRARAYSPRWGRFLQTDPIGAADNANLYAYVGNDPINFIDPSGLLAEQVEDFAGRLYQDTILRAADDISRLFNRFRQDPFQAVASVANSFPQTRVEGSIASTLAALSTLGRSANPMAGAAKTPLSNAQLVQEIATRAEVWGARQGLPAAGRGSVQGTLKHDYAARLLDRYQSLYGSRGLETEVSLFRGGAVNYGTAGSVRLDVLEAATGTAWDYKFTLNPTLSPSRLQRIFNNAPVNTVIPVGP